MVVSNINQDQLASLLEENMGLVVFLAKSFNPTSHYDLEEFIQIGRIAAWKAILKHDPERAALSTLIWHHVRWAILRDLDRRKKQHVQLDDTIPIEDKSVSSIVWEYVPDYLTNNEQTVLDMRMQGHTFVDICSTLGFSRGWSNNVFKSAIKKINEANEKKTNLNV